MRLNAEALRGGFRLIGSILLWLAVVIAVIGWGGAHQPEMDALHRSVFYSMAQDCALGGNRSRPPQLLRVGLTAPHSALALSTNKGRSAPR